MKSILLMAFLIFSAGTWADCSSQLAESFQTPFGSEEELSLVDQFKAYLEVLYEKHVVTLVDLHRAQEVFQKTGQLENPLKKTDTPNIERDIHYDNLQNYVQFFSPEEVKEIGSWFTQFIAGIEKVLQAKSQANAQTEQPFRPIKFLQFKANGTTSASKNYKRFINFIQSTLTRTKFIVNHDFEIMDAPVTQFQWAKIMKYNPSSYPEETDLNLLNRVLIDGKVLVMNGDDAVNEQTLWDAMKFANQMSILNNLKPVYDLSKVGLRRLADKPHLLKINAPNGDIYQAEGYRLPTASEMQMVLQDPVLKEDLKFDRSTTNSRAFVQTAMGDPFYFIMDNSEWLSEYFQGVARVDGDSMINFKSARKGEGHYYGFRDSLYGFTDNGDYDRRFRLVRSIFKNKEEAKP